MSYSNKIKNFEELININANGISVPTFDQIREALIQNYQNIWGTDIDTEKGTVDGQAIFNEANMINNVMLALNKLQSQMNPNTTTGRMLDTICSFSGVTRQKESASYCDMYVKYVGSRIQFFSTLGSGDNNIQKIVVVDRNSITWTWSESKIDGGEFNTIFKPDSDEKEQIYYLRFTCDMIGPNAAQAADIEKDEEGNPILTDDNHGFIYQTIDNIIYPFQVWQQYDAIIGSYEETDQSLRNRRLSSKSDNGISTLSGLKGSLESLGGIKEVKIYNNNSITDITSKDNTSIPAHSVYICARYEETNLKNIDSINALDSVIGETIYNKLTPGVMTTVPIIQAAPIKREYVYTLDDSIAASPIYWKLCSPVIFNNINVSIIPLDTYDKKICEAEITKNCKNFARSLSINSDLSIYDLISYLNQNSSLINNKTPYFCKSGYINANQTLLENTDGYFDLSHFISGGSSEEGWVNITILGADKATKANIYYPDMVCYKESLLSNMTNYSLLTTVGNIFTADGQGGNWGNTSVQTLSELYGTQYNGASAENPNPTNVNFVEEKIVLYTGENFNDYFTFTAPYGGGQRRVELSLEKNNYYKFSIGSSQTSTGNTYCITASPIFPYDNAYFTINPATQDIKNITDINNISSFAWLSVIDQNNNGKYLFKEGYFEGGTLEYVDVYYHYTYGESEITLEINTSSTND